MGSGFISQVEKGDFLGHPASLAWADRPDSPVKMRADMIYSKVDPRDNPRVKPEYVKNEPISQFIRLKVIFIIYLYLPLIKKYNGNFTS